MIFKAKVYVTLKESVLDPQGVAVANCLHTLGYKEVEDVRVGKYTTVTLKAENIDQATKSIEEMCDKLLANPVIEEYSFEIEEVI